jgi:hypothetical protein
MAGAPSVMAEQYFVDGIRHTASLTKTAETNDVLSVFR